MTKAAESKLIATIERAWADTPSPPEGQITAAAKQYDDSAELERALRGRHWRDVPHETVYAARIDLSLLSPQGLRFYLPAWLLAALEDEQIRIFLLSYFEVAIENGTLAKALPYFSDAERAALRDFFEYMAATDEEDWRKLAAAVPATG
jgi:hypothetical protein